MAYTMDPDPDITAKAYGREFQISTKESVEICKYLRGRDVDSALNILEDVIEGHRAIPYRKHNKQVSHNKGVGPGGYPKKASQKIRDLIEEAQHNAENKGLDSDNMKILSLVAHKGSPIKGYIARAQGRSTPHNRHTTNVEVILQEEEE
ncbi:MAG: 50S ribosomal protein L22 [Thermoplasmatota archaeon]